MRIIKEQCRVCGKDYTPCRTGRYKPGVFRWQEVACSPECGSIYFERVLEARREEAEKTNKTESSEPEETVLDVSVDESDESEDDEDDESEFTDYFYVDEDEDE